MNTKDLTIFKSKSEDLNRAPLFFGKLCTKKNEKNIEITSLFYAKKTKEDIINGVKCMKENKMLVEKNPLEYIQKKCFAIAYLKFEGVFIESQIESIHVKVPEAVITKISSPFQTIIGEDLDLGEMESDDEM